MVFELTVDGRQPIADVRVAMDVLDAVVAETSTDATGRYLLCGLAQEPLDGLFAYKNGYALVSFNVGPGSDAVIDIEIKRR